MNHKLVGMFIDKLESFTISDYYGLNSLGMTCYLNSVLQVFFMTDGFREAVNRCCCQDPTTIDLFLGRLFSGLQKNVAQTHDVTKRLGITDVYEQRDSAEYFEKILCLNSPEAAQMLKGELKHQNTCLTCQERNHSTGFFWILPLAVEELADQTCSVEKALRAFFKGEKACGDNKIYCKCCDSKQEAEIGCEIKQRPEVLTLLLKRFRFDDKQRCYTKLRCSVDVPHILHIESCKYVLYALLNHFGDLKGGHYTAHVKSYENKWWYHFNDDVVKRVDPPPSEPGAEGLRSCFAYLLMYQKC
ncbi:ubiquitin carboxyl-terminal hydrolase 50-like isoform X1 [Antennarius striatus]|uniref:ubiquitin carboxyl-terminal hydrolase 50-like isoform X1 n=1 Tax=Antennarius striatus TaxID=241820 RepID=UPI0035B3DABE